MRLAFNVTVNSYDTRPTAPGFRIFFQLKRASRKPLQIPCVFSMKVCLAFKLSVNLYVMLSIAPTFLVFFRRKCASQESCRIRWVHFPCVFSGNPRLAFRSDCEFTCDAANCSLIPNTFPRKARLAWLCSSQTAGRSCEVGMSKVAYHRMLVGGLDVVKRGKRWNTIGPSQKRQPFKRARKKCNEKRKH